MNKTTQKLFLLLILILSIVSIKAEDEEVLFSHKMHIEEAEAECSACHSNVANSKDSKKDNLMNLESCFECHDEDDINTDKYKQDKKKTTEIPIVKGYIKNFLHANHNNLKCLDCHSGVEISEDMSVLHMPNMDLCTKCHSTISDISESNYCYICHSKKDNLEPEDHKLDWKKQHGIAKNSESSNCASCHSDNMCLTCHSQSNLKSSSHPLNYINNHGMSAKGNKDNCYVCHEELSDCMQCHTSRMVMPRSHASAGWSNRTTGGAHKRAAELDMDNCTSCHSDAKEQPVCSQCHTR